MNENLCRLTVAERSKGFCEARMAGKDSHACRGMANSMHHRRKRSQGGLWTPSNVLHLCGDGTIGCHGYIEANPATARRNGLWLYSGQDPAMSPALVHFRGIKGWWMLDDEGSMQWLSNKAVQRLKLV